MGRPCPAYVPKFSGEISSNKGTEFSLTNAARESEEAEETWSAGKTAYPSSNCLKRMMAGRETDSGRVGRLESA